jgi:hypothetical protein
MHERISVDIVVNLLYLFERNNLCINLTTLDNMKNALCSMMSYINIDLQDIQLYWKLKFFQNIANVRNSFKKVFDLIFGDKNIKTTQLHYVNVSVVCTKARVETGGCKADESRRAAEGSGRVAQN